MPSSTFSFRKINQSVHLWLGLVTAIFLTVICLTGTIFVFHTEIEKIVYPHYFKVSPIGKSISPDSLIYIVEKETKGKVLSFRIPDSKEEVWVFNIKEKKSNKEILNKKATSFNANKGESDKSDRGKPFYINPYTGKITYSGATSLANFFRSVEDIHRFFFLGKPVGKVISGATSLLFVCIIFSGVVIWFPRKIKHWKEGFKIKFKAHWKRVNFDLHRALGIIVFPIVLVCALTGPAWSFEWYRLGILSPILGDEVFKQRNEKPIKIKPPFTQKSTITIERAIQLVRQETTMQKALTVINLPKDSAETITISLIHSGFAKLNANDKYAIDAYDGAIVKRDLFVQKSFGEKLASLVKSFHMGEFYGTFSKIIYFIACLLASSLPLTGILIWWNKKKKKPKSKSKTA